MVPQTASGKEAINTLPKVAEAVVMAPANSGVRTVARRSVAALLTDWRLLFWNFFLVVASPLLFLMKARKYWKKRHNYEFNLKRWSLPEKSVPPEGKPHLIFVGATYGEVRLAEPLIQQFKEEHPELFVTIATRDVHTIEEWNRSRPDDRIVLLPFDFIWPAAKFLRREKPDYMVFLEMYSFPNLLMGAKRTGARLAVANGRSKDFQGPSRYERGYYKWILRQFDVLSVQTSTYRDRIWDLAPGPEPIVTGNLKLVLEKATLNGANGDQVKAWLSIAEDLPILAAGSSNTDQEDDFILNAFEKVRARANCRLLFAPRNLARVPRLLRCAAAKGFSVSRRSQNDAPSDIMLLDTIGELRYAYKHTVAAYVGGSLNGMGHNVLEPALLGLPVSYGPRRGHFEDFQVACEEAHVGFRLSTSDELAEHWTKVLCHPEFLEFIRRQTPTLLDGQEIPLHKTVEALNRLFV